MSIGKTITTFIITALIGVFTFIFAVPKKMVKSRNEDVKTRTKGEEKDNLFI